MAALLCGDSPAVEGTIKPGSLRDASPSRRPDLGCSLPGPAWSESGPREKVYSARRHPVGLNDDLLLRFRQRSKPRQYGTEDVAGHRSWELFTAGRRYGDANHVIVGRVALQSGPGHLWDEIRALRHDLPARSNHSVLQEPPVLQTLDERFLRRKSARIADGDRRYPLPGHDVAVPLVAQLPGPPKHRLGTAGGSDEEKRFAA